ncbi:MAG: NAD(P)H-hydrate dehydratase [Fermentimonas sp.]
MKILTSEQIREIDAQTVLRERISSLDLMERAATAFYHWLIEKYDREDISILVFAGVGNNGGDALAVARMLHGAGYPVKVVVVEYSASYSNDCLHNLRRAMAAGISCTKIVSASDIPQSNFFQGGLPQGGSPLNDSHKPNTGPSVPELGLSDLSPFDEYDLLIDGLFGTGFNREVSGLAREVIARMNESGKRIVSIDVPSGLFLDRKTAFAVEASETVTFQIPKLALYLPGNQHFCGEVWHVEIGLSETAIAEADSDTFFTRGEEARGWLKLLPRFAHKGTLGHALVIGGSLGMMGSVCLAAKAALRSGCGLVTAYLPHSGVPIIQGYFPEAMAVGDAHGSRITAIEYNLKPNAIGIGIGMGQHHDTTQALYRFLKKIHGLENSVPLVVDADGLNILSKHPGWLSLLPPGTVLTPHPKELSRLIGEWSDDFDKIQKTRAFAREYGVIVVVKGAFSLVIDAETIHVNSSGTPALATAGSGDVLTGMITGLLAQGYPPLDAARLGVYLHGLTANLATGRMHERAFIASDIIDGIGSAYAFLENVHPEVF